MEAIATSYEEYDKEWHTFIDSTGVPTGLQPFMPAARRIIRGMYSEKGREESEEVHGLVKSGSSKKEYTLTQIRNAVMDKSNLDEEVADELIPVEATEAEFWKLPQIRLKFSAARTTLTTLTLGPSIKPRRV